MTRLVCWSLALVSVSLLAGCGSIPPSAGELFLARQGRSMLLVLDGSGRSCGVGVVVRASYGEVYVALATPAEELPDELLLAVGEQAIAAKLRPAGGVTILEARQAGRDLRAVVPGSPPVQGAGLLILSAARGPWVDIWTSEVASSGADEILLTPPRPAREIDSLPPLDALRGSPVFALTGNLVGFVLGVDDSARLAVAPIDQLTPRLLEACGGGGGAEVLGPDDAELAFEVEVSEISGLPTIGDDWGSPDYDLLLELAGTMQPRLPLDLHRVSVVTAPAAGPVVVTLVERDIGLFDGDVAEDVAHPVRLQALGRRTTLEFDLLGRLHERYPETDLAGRPRVVLDVTSRDPDLASGPDRTVLGARQAPLRRAVRGEVHRAGGDATDHWTVEFDQPTAVWCAILRPAHANLTVEAFGPDLGDTRLRWREDDGTLASLPPPITGAAYGRLIDRPPLISVGARDLHAPQTGYRLSIGRAALPAGRCLFRVRALGASQGEIRYGLLVIPSDDSEGLVRALFRLISRESQLGWPALHAPEFVDEVAHALSRDAELTHDEAQSAALAELGHRTPAVRRLALGLLESYYPPPVGILERIVSTGSGPRARDAGLLLALRRPDDERYAGLVRRASGDPDPRIRLRALVIAGRLHEGDLRESLLDLFEDDPAPLVRRALARVRG